MRTGYIFLGWTGEGITEPQKTVEIPQGSTGDRTYTANWQVIEYTVTLDVSGGDPLDPITYTVETPVILPTPTSTGYTFLGWTGEGETTPQPTVVLPKGTTGDKMYFANWEVNIYAITLDTSGGNALEAISYAVTSSPITLPTPVRTGYTFKGWTGEGIVNPQTEVIIPTGSTGNRTYTANWEATVYTIMLKNLPNGNETIPYTVEQEVKLPYPEKGGYFFEGWSGTGMTGQEYYVTIPEGTTGNREYTAHWKPTTYEIAFLMNGGEPLASISYTVESPDFDLPIPVRNGYKFVGWTSDGITVPQEIVTIHQGSMGFRMYTAHWKLQKYTIALGANGGEDLAAISYTIESDPIKLPTPERKGYEFIGWIGDGIDGTQPEVIIPTGSTGDRTYIAFWRVIRYLIELRQSSGHWMQTFSYTVEEEVELPIPTREGYEFIGWVGEDIIDAQINVTIPRGSTGFRLYAAHWALENYTITLDTSGGNALNDIRYTAKSDPITLPTPTRNGYEFVGWTGEGITTPQTSVEIPKGSTGNRTYTANWQEQLVEPTLPPPPMPMLTINVVCRDADSKEVLRVVSYTPSVESEDFTLNFDSIDVTGRKFVEAFDDSGSKLTSITIPQGSRGQRDYDAYFAKETYTITLDTNGGAAMSPINYTVTDSVTLRNPPDRPGYEFSGWVLDGSGQFPSTPMIIPAGSTGDRRYTEEWRVASYTITYVSHGKAYNWVQYTINNRVYFGTPEEDPSYYLPGYTFVGWKIDGVEGTPRSYMLPKGSYGNRTATMLWEAIP